MEQNILINFQGDKKNINKIIFFGIGSAILLTIHSIFLGIKFEYDLYKLFRRVVMLLFIIFEIIRTGDNNSIDIHNINLTIL